MTRVRSKIQPSLLRQLNEQQVLNAIATLGPLSRAEVTRHTGISPPTVSKTVALLLKSGLLEEGEFQQSNMGRPGKTLRMASRTVQVIGGEIGTRRCHLLRTGLDGEITKEVEPSGSTFATPATYEELIETVAVQIEKLRDAAQIPLMGVGLSMPGLLRRRDSRTLFSPNLHQTDNRQFGIDLEARVGVPIRLIQEAKALCLAERTSGQAKEIQHFAMMDLQDGLGLGVITGDDPLEGHDGLAGELGHITVNASDGAKRCGCGNLGCLETEATDSALATAVSTRVGRPLEFDELAKLVAAGQLDVTSELKRVEQYLAIGLAAVMNLFNPEAIFLYARLFDLDSSIFDRVCAKAKERSLAPISADCRIIRARGNKLQGALAAVIRNVTGREVTTG